MPKVVASIVTYNPDISFLKRNIESIRPYVDEVVLVDNYSYNCLEIQALADKLYIDLIANKENLGIAKALNQALDHANNRQANYLLTMDQDSYFADDSVEVLQSVLEKDDVIAMVGPIMHDVTSGFIENQQEELQEVKTLITSGALCRVDVLTKIGGWQEELFIDAVDFEIGYRLRILGYKLLKSKKAVLHHSLGDSIQKKCIISFLVTNHSSTRVYYASRNTVYLLKKYFSVFPKEMVQLFLSNNKKLIAILLFEKSKINKISNFFLGFYHGLIGKFGQKI